VRTGRPRKRYGRHAYVRQAVKVAHLLGLDEDTLKSYVTEGMPGPDARGFWCVPRCFAWLARREAGLTSGAGKISDSVKASLEREKLAKLRRQNEIEAGRLIDREVASAWLELATTPMAAAFQRLQDAYGEEAADLVREAFEQMASEIERRFGSS